MTAAGDRFGWARRVSAEFAGTGLLTVAVIGSGIAAARLSPDPGVRLLANSVATAFGLGVLIVVFGPVSGAHFNPVVSMLDWWAARRSGVGLTGRQLGGYVAAQVTGAVGGAAVADVMFGVRPVSWSTTVRSGPRLWLAEVLATAGLLLLITALSRTGQRRVAPAAIGAWIGGAYWFTSSTAFANPAVTIGRAFTDTYAGISPASVPAFCAVQLAGTVAAAAAIRWWYPTPVAARGPAAAVEVTPVAVSTLPADADIGGGALR